MSKAIHFSLHDDSVPVHSYFTITIEDDNGGSKENVYY
jgi:hypothetical protein